MAKATSGTYYWRSRSIILMKRSRQMGTAENPNWRCHPRGWNMTIRRHVKLLHPHNFIPDQLVNHEGSRHIMSISPDQSFHVWWHNHSAIAKITVSFADNVCYKDLILIQTWMCSYLQKSRILTTRNVKAYCENTTQNECLQLTNFNFWFGFITVDGIFDMNLINIKLCFCFSRQLEA